MRGRRQLQRRAAARGGAAAAGQRRAVQRTVFVLLQKGQLKAVSSFGAAAFGGGFAALLRLPMAAGAAAGPS